MDETHAININKEQQESLPYQDQEDKDAILATIQCDTESLGQRNVLGQEIPGVQR